MTIRQPDWRSMPLGQSGAIAAVIIAAAPAAASPSSARIHGEDGERYIHNWKLIVSVTRALGLHGLLLDQPSRVSFDARLTGQFKYRYAVLALRQKIDGDEPFDQRCKRLMENGFSLDLPEPFQLWGRSFSCWRINGRPSATKANL